jgi:hypothetical protein
MPPIRNILAVLFVILSLALAPLLSNRFLSFFTKTPAAKMARGAVIVFSHGGGELKRLNNTT